MNTPETDKRVWSDHSEGILHEVVEASFARRLERERDEAREKLARIESLLLDPHAVFLNFLHGKIAKLDWAKLEHINGPHPARVECDEAREKAERYRLEANAMMLQRDEAQNKLRLGKLTIISQKEEIELLRQQLIEARNK